MFRLKQVLLHSLPMVSEWTYAALYFLQYWLFHERWEAVLPHLVYCVCGGTVPCGSSLIQESRESELRDIMHVQDFFLNFLKGLD